MPCIIGTSNAILMLPGTDWDILGKRKFGDTEPLRYGERAEENSVCDIPRFGSTLEIERIFLPVVPEFECYFFRRGTSVFLFYLGVIYPTRKGRNAVHDGARTHEFSFAVECTNLTAVRKAFCPCIVTEGANTVALLPVCSLNR